MELKIILLKNLIAKPISSSSIKVDQLELVCDVENYDEMDWSFEQNKVIINFFPSLNTRESGLLHDALSQSIEEITIKYAYQFFRNENSYVDSFDPIQTHIDNNQKLRKIIFEFDDKIVDTGGELDGSWSIWDYTLFADTIYKWLTNNPHLIIEIKFNDLIKNFEKSNNSGKFFDIFFLYQKLQKNSKLKKRFILLNINNQLVDRIVFKSF